MTEEEIDREIHNSFVNFLLDSWGILESELYDHLDLPGRGIICEFSAGAQGIVFMTEDGGFVKVTESRAEAAFATLVRDWALPEFPMIHDIYAFELGTTPLFAIYRESVDDYLGPFPDETIDDLVHDALEGLRTVPPSFEEMERLRELAPHHHAELTSLLAALDDLADRTGMRVHDLHSENIGQASDGRVVVRDFGMNSLTPAQIEDAISSIPEFPEPVAGLAA